MAETSQMELELLQTRADAANFYVQRHKHWDPTRGNGDLYLQRKVKFRDEPKTDIMPFSRAEQIHAKLTELGA